MVQGANYDPLYTITEDNVALDVSSAEITISVKETKTAAGAALIEKQNAAAGGGADEIEMGPENNQFSMHILPADTANLPNLDKEYWVELKIIIGTSIIKYMHELYIEQSLTG